MTARVEPVDAAPSLITDLQNHLLLFFTGAAHQSWNILAEQEKSTYEHNRKPLDALHQIKHLAYAMRDALTAGDLSTFASWLHESWQAKKQVSNKISQFPHRHSVSARHTP